MQLQNGRFKIVIDDASGAIRSLVIKEIDCDLISEQRLAANFRICLPLPDYQCNYIDGIQQVADSISRQGDTVSLTFSRLSSPRGEFNIDVVQTVEMTRDDIRFRAKLVNHEELAISEFWFPRIGGWTQFGSGRRAMAATPGYKTCGHNLSFFRAFPGRQGLGAEAAEWSANYPGMVMPWIDLHDPASGMGLYMGYHDTTFRFSTWHTYLYPTISGREDKWLGKDESGDLPVGLVFSHVRYPFISAGESFESGEFILRPHKGDWHEGALFYREWFMRHFPFDKSASWLRKKRSWFSSILYQPEDRIVADYEGYDTWCQEAKSSRIDTHELIGWDKGGLERDYPEYEPEDKLGGRDGFRRLLKNIESRGDKCLVFINYNILDQNTAWFRDELCRYQMQDQFGKQPVWMAWGESTLLARLGLNVRRHLVASVVPEFESILERFFLDRVRDGAHGFQIDKLCVGSRLDFNPLNKLKPDVALCGGLVDAIGRLLAKCREINPDFCFAAEAGQDRLLPYADVFYRNSSKTNISPLRYVFPEWTSCQHISEPKDFQGVNGAVLTGSVICVEPLTYQGSLGHPLYGEMRDYLREVDLIREEFADILFLGAYYDTCGAVLTSGDLTDEPAAENAEVRGEEMIPDGGGAQSAVSEGLVYRVHGHRLTDQRAIVITNNTESALRYRWSFTHRDVSTATLLMPFHARRTVSSHETMTIEKNGLHILVEEPI